MSKKLWRNGEGMSEKGEGWVFFELWQFFFFEYGKETAATQARLANRARSSGLDFPIRIQSTDRFKISSFGNTYNFNNQHRVKQILQTVSLF